MLGIPYRQAPAEVDEAPQAGEEPAAYAARVAEAKARAAVGVRAGELVLGADTVVVLGEEMFGKPADAAEARRMLSRLAGREHRVMSAVALLGADRIEREIDVTRVTMRRLDPDVIAGYVATGESLDKAGAYGIQGYGAALVDRIDGDFFGVMGLPIRLVLALLERFGHRYDFTR